MKANDFLKDNIIDLQKWKEKNNYPIYNVNYDILYDDFIHLWSTDDEWEDVNIALFLTAQELYDRDEQIPNNWQLLSGLKFPKRDQMTNQEKYNKALQKQKGNMNDDIFYDLLDLKHADTQSLIKFGDFLMELRKKLQQEGKDY